MFTPKTPIPLNNRPSFPPHQPPDSYSSEQNPIHSNSANPNIHKARREIVPLVAQRSPSLRVATQRLPTPFPHSRKISMTQLLNRTAKAREGASGEEWAGSEVGGCVGKREGGVQDMLLHRNAPADPECEGRGFAGGRGL